MASTGSMEPHDYKSLLAQQRATVHGLVSHRKAQAISKWMDAAQVHPSKRDSSSSSDDDDESIEPGPTTQTPWGASDRWSTVQSESESARARTRSRHASSPDSEVVGVRREHGLRVPTSLSASAKPAPAPRPRLSSLALRREELRQGAETHRLKEHGAPASAGHLGLDLAAATAQRAAVGLSGGRSRLQAAAALSLIHI